MREANLHPDTEKLQSFAEGDLGEADVAVLESHLLGCSSCQKEVEEWRSLFAVLSGLPQFTPSVHFADNVMRSVTLPDPWYVRALAQVGDRLQVYAPKTNRGWALATACLALPITVFAALTVWVMSKSYLTPSNVFAYAMDKSGSFMGEVAKGALAQLLQTDLAMFAARSFADLSAAGLETAGALLAGVFIATAGSAYILYQNLFRATAQRNRHYASYSF
jgi:anti-sigma factor RsiW